MNTACRRLVELYQSPERAGELPPADWEEVVRLASKTGLMGRLGGRLEAAALMDRVPPAVQDHFVAASRLAASYHRNVRWEVRQIRSALYPRSIPFALLKGAAYVMAELPAAQGRIFNDVDILVPQERLAEAEGALEIQGWVTTHRHPYDQRYYRRWMHELPPMEHVHRGTNLDVHHAILPRTAARRPDPELLWEAARPLPDWPGVWVLAPEDMVLHAAAHLFFDGALENGLRDLTDIDALLHRFGGEPGFWARLTQRAETLELAAPLGDALHWCRRLLGTPFPEEHLILLRGSGWQWLRAKGRNGLFAQGLKPTHPLCGGPWNGAMRGGLYLRSHLLRMPWYRLLPHLVRKGLRPPSREGI